MRRISALLLSGCLACSTADSEPGSESPDAATSRLKATPTAITSEPEDEAAFLYEQSELRTFEIKVSPENLARLDADPTAEEYVEGHIVFDGKEYGPVGVRYKGSFGAWVLCTENSTPQSPLTIGGSRSCPKLNLKISFNWADPDGRFFGLKKLQFHAMNSDSSLMRERLGYWLFRKMGVPAPRAVHARVMVNGQLSGIYVNVEYIDGRFTRSRFENGKGNLYKEAWPTASKHQLAQTEESLLGALRTNEDEEPTVHRMLQFGEAVNTAGEDARADVVAQWMDINNTMRMVAVDRTIRADDGLFHFYCQGPSCSNHNFYIYEPDESGQFVVIPWDLDNSFVVVQSQGISADSFVKVVSEWDDHSVSCAPHDGALPGLPTQLPPSCDPLINAWASFSTEYRSAVEELLNGAFSEASVDEQLSAWEAQISATVEEANATTEAQLDPSAWQAALLNLRERTVILRDTAAKGGPIAGEGTNSSDEATDAPVTCGGVVCSPSPLDTPLCCTAAGAGDLGHPLENTGRAPDLCGTDIGQLDASVAGICLQTAQPGVLDASCPAYTAGGTREGCCTDEGYCGSMENAVGLGCLYGPEGRGAPCGANTADAGATP